MSSLKIPFLHIVWIKYHRRSEGNGRGISLWIEYWWLHGCADTFAVHRLQTTASGSRYAARQQRCLCLHSAVRFSHGLLGQRCIDRTAKGRLLQNKGCSVLWMSLLWRRTCSTVWISSDILSKLVRKPISILMKIGMVEADMGRNTNIGNNIMRCRWSSMIS